MDLNNNKFLRWLIFFALFFFGLFCFMKDKGYCSFPIDQEYLFQNCQCRSSWQAKPGHQNDNTKSKRQEWQEAYDNHHFNAVRTYNDAYNRIWWLPDLTLRQIGRDAWTSACAMASTKTVCSALVVAFSAMLSQYGLHCLDEWDYIQEKLQWSQYHFDQCAMYANLLHG